MKRILICASFLAAASAAANLQAQVSFRQEVDISGSVLRKCAATESGGAASIAFGENIADASNVANNGQREMWPFGSVTCNYPANVSLQSSRGAMRNGSSACNFSGNDPYFNCVRYNALLEWGPITKANLTADGTPNIKSEDVAAAAPFTGNLTLTITINSLLTKPLAYGDYSDTLIVQVGADL
jgi:hypothetical protein